MERNENISIRNIYHMLSYAYQTLHLSEYKDVGSESFEHVKDLYAEILLIGIPVLIRGGLLKDYVRFEEASNVVKSKIDLNATIKKNALVNKKLIVVYDEFSEDILFNQMIKATLVYLARSSHIKKSTRRAFHGLLPYFSEVSDVELKLSLWSLIQYNRQNIRYQFVLDVCRYLYEELLLDESSTSESMRQIQDEQRLAALYEKFVFAFYKRETNYHLSSPQFRWKVDDEYYDALPIMRTDVVLKKGNQTLIIDTKFYTDNMVARFEGGATKQKTGNLYQIFSYVMNWERKSEDESVGGMLLYAKTNALNQPDHTYSMMGNQIFVVSLDLNQEFGGIKDELIGFAERYFN